MLAPASHEDRMTDLITWMVSSILLAVNKQQNLDTAMALLHLELCHFIRYLRSPIVKEIAEKDNNNSDGM